jgi:hypothetical protein
MLTVGGCPLITLSGWFFLLGGRHSTSTPVFFTYFKRSPTLPLLVLASRKHGKEFIKFIKEKVASSSSSSLPKRVVSILWLQILLENCALSQASDQQYNQNSAFTKFSQILSLFNTSSFFLPPVLEWRYLSLLS